MKSEKLSTLLGTVGVLGGIFYSMKKHNGFATTAMYAIGFGAAGFFIGNAINKFK